MADHNLAVRINGKVEAVCDCGEEFEGTPSQAIKAWEVHREIVDLLEKAREAALAELTARAEGEAAIRRLLELDVSTRAISQGIGEVDGKLMVSPTLIQRLGRGDHRQTPRRRKRS